jgi:anti-anti-sigma regulatory factor
MAVIATLLKIDEERVVDALQEAREKLDGADGEVVLDFASVRRIDSLAIRALEVLADQADGKGTKVVLRSVPVEVYRVLKLVKLVPRLSFTN